jgi:hypothetical protein
MGVCFIVTTNIAYPKLFMAALEKNRGFGGAHLEGVLPKLWSAAASEARRRFLKRDLFCCVITVNAVNPASNSCLILVAAQ